MEPKAGSLGTKPRPPTALMGAERQSGAVGLCRRGEEDFGGCLQSEGSTHGVQQRTGALMSQWRGLTKQGDRQDGYGSSRVGGQRGAGSLRGRLLAGDGGGPGQASPRPSTCASSVLKAICLPSRPCPLPMLKPGAPWPVRCPFPSPTSCRLRIPPDLVCQQCGHRLCRFAVSPSGLSLPGGWT